MYTQPTAKPVPLALAAKRLAPAVATGLVAHTEALDTLMEIAADRGMLTGWERADGLTEWLSATLHRETDAWLQRRRETRRAAA